jgi:hypothetical protein
MFIDYHLVPIFSVVSVYYTNAERTPTWSASLEPLEGPKHGKETNNVGTLADQVVDFLFDIVGLTGLSPVLHSKGDNCLLGFFLYGVRNRSNFWDHLAMRPCSDFGTAVLDQEGKVKHVFHSLCKQLGVEHVLNGIHFTVFPFVLLVGGQFGNF